METTKEKNKNSGTGEKGLSGNINFEEIAEIPENIAEIDSILEDGESPGNISINDDNVNPGKNSVEEEIHLKDKADFSSIEIADDFDEDYSFDDNSLWNSMNVDFESISAEIDGYTSIKKIKKKTEKPRDEVVVREVKIISPSKKKDDKKENERPGEIIKETPESPEISMEALDELLFQDDFEILEDTTGFFSEGKTQEEKTVESLVKIIEKKVREEGDNAKAENKIFTSVFSVNEISLPIVVVDEIDEEEVLQAPKKGKDYLTLDELEEKADTKDSEEAGSSSGDRDNASVSTGTHIYESASDISHENIISAEIEQIEISEDNMSDNGSLKEIQSPPSSLSSEEDTPPVVAEKTPVPEKEDKGAANFEPLLDEFLKMPEEESGPEDSAFLKKPEISEVDENIDITPGIQDEEVLDEQEQDSLSLRDIEDVQLPVEAYLEEPHDEIDKETAPPVQVEIIDKGKDRQKAVKKKRIKRKIRKKVLGKEDNVLKIEIPEKIKQKLPDFNIDLKYVDLGEAEKIANEGMTIINEKDFAEEMDDFEFPSAEDEPREQKSPNVISDEDDLLDEDEYIEEYYDDENGYVDDLNDEEDERDQYDDIDDPDIKGGIDDYLSGKGEASRGPAGLGSLGETILTLKEIYDSTVGKINGSDDQKIDIDISDSIVLLNDSKDLRRFVENIPPEKKENLVKLLKYFDGLFDKLPEDVISKFASSEYFNLYMQVINDMEL